jgi:hypothetical protein
MKTIITLLLLLISLSSRLNAKMNNSLRMCTYAEERIIHRERKECVFAFTSPGIEKCKSITMKTLIFGKRKCKLRKKWGLLLFKPEKITAIRTSKPCSPLEVLKWNSMRKTCAYLHNEKSLKSCVASFEEYKKNHTRIDCKFPFRDNLAFYIDQREFDIGYELIQSATRYLLRESSKGSL